MSNSPRVSVIIPTYNRAAYLVEAVESVLAQTYNDYEVIVADDGSTDDTAERMAAFGGSVRHLRLSHNGSPSVVRNRGLEVARGELVAFLDDDDRWHPEKLQYQIALLANEPALGFVYSDLRLFSAAGVSAPVLASWQKQRGNIFDALLRDCFVHTSTVIIRRSLLQVTGRFNEALASAEDFDLWLRLAHAAPAGFVDAPLTFVRRHPDEISHHRQETSNRSVIFTLEHTRDHVPLSLRQRLRLRLVLARRYTHLGNLLRTTGKTPSARQHFWQALRLNPLLVRAWMELAGTIRSPSPPA